MDDLISRKQAFLAVNERIRQIGKDNDPQVLSIRQAIVDVPSAQQTGTWIVQYGACEPDYMECNKCGWITEYYGGLEEEWNYCPHCGARMERE